MVSIEQKDIFMAKSGLIRIDQLLGMKNKNHLCLVQSEDDVILFEIWDMFEERILQQKKINLYNYELSSNVITLDSNQLAFYGVIHESGVQCLFLVDIFYDPNQKQQEDEIQKNQNEQIMRMMIDEQHLDEAKEINPCLNLNNPESDIMQKRDEAASTKSPNSKKGIEKADKLQHYKQDSFKQQNKEALYDDLLDVDSCGNVELKEKTENLNQIHLPLNGQSQLHKIHHYNGNTEQQYNSFEETNIQSLPVIEDKNLALFLEQLADKQEISLMNSFITNDFQAASAVNELQNIMEDINCLNNYEQNNYMRNEIPNYKEFLPSPDIKKQQLHFRKQIVKEEEDNLSVRDNCSFSNSNIKDHKIKQYAPDFKHSSNSYEQNLNKDSHIKGLQNDEHANNIKQKTIFQSPEHRNNSSHHNNSNQMHSSRSGSQAENVSGIEGSNKYYGEHNEDINCIYDGNQRELFDKCVEFYSEILGQGYHGIIIVKNTYYMTNYDDSFYFLLVLSVYRTGNSQQFAQYIIRRETNDLNNSIQIICVQNTHQLMIYDQSMDEMIIWSYFADALTPTYYTFQEFQSLQIKYCFQNGNSAETYHFVYKDQQSNMYKILSYDFKKGNNITKGFANKELQNLRSPIIIKQQEAYVIKNHKQFMLVICTIYKNNEMTTYWNVYSLNCTASKQSVSEEGFLQSIHTHIEASETDNNDIQTHFVPNFSLVSPNIYFFNTSDIHLNVQSAISTFIHNRDIHFKAITILKD